MSEIPDPQLIARLEAEIYGHSWDDATDYEVRQTVPSRTGEEWREPGPRNPKTLWDLFLQRYMEAHWMHNPYSRRFAKSEAYRVLVRSVASRYWRIGAVALNVIMWIALALVICLK